MSGALFALLLSACTSSQGGGQPGGPIVTPGGPDVVTTTTPGLTLQALPSDGTPNEVQVAVVLGVPNGPAARVMELQLRHSPDLEYVSSTKGGALATADKDLVVQAKTADLVRAVAYSGANVNTIASGTLVTIRFKAKGAGPYRLELLTDKPIFAPPQANDGLHVSDPIYVQF